MDIKTEIFSLKLYPSEVADDWGQHIPPGEAEAFEKMMDRFPGVRGYLDREADKDMLQWSRTKERWISKPRAFP